MSNAAYAAWLDVGDRPFPLVGKTLSLGRARDNNVVFTSTKVSRRHALVHAQGGAEFSLVDLGSSNGTHLNGRRVVHQSVAKRELFKSAKQSLVFRLEIPPDFRGTNFATQTQRTVREVKEMTCFGLLLDIQRTPSGGGRMLAEVGANGGHVAGRNARRVIEESRRHRQQIPGRRTSALLERRFATAQVATEALNAFLPTPPSTPLSLPFTPARRFSAFSPPPWGELSPLGQDLNFLFQLSVSPQPISLVRS